MDIITLALAKKYTDTSLAGGGAIQGKNCVVDSITAITGGHRVTFKWTLDNGTEETGYMDVMDGDKGDQGDQGIQGVSIAGVTVNSNNHLIVTYDNGNSEDAGQIIVTTATFGGMLDVNFTDLANGQIAKYNAETHKWENADESKGGNVSWEEATGTLTAGQTQITLTSPAITQNSTLNLFTTVPGVNPTDIELIGSNSVVMQGWITQESELDIIATASLNNGDAWKAFTDGRYAWFGTEADTAQWFQMEFNNPVSLSRLTFGVPFGYTYPDKIQYSEDGRTWTDATASGYWYSDLTITNAPARKYWRIAWTATIPTKPALNQVIVYGNGYSAVVTFPVQQENIGVKVRVS